jgi:phytoene synthase
MSTATLDTRADEDQWIWESFRYHSRTFSLAARLLPSTVQMPVATLYLFCRHIDTIADHRVEEVGPDRAIDEVHTARRRLDATLAGHPPDDDLLWQRLAEVHDDYQLRPDPLYELVDGALWDLNGRSVHTLDDLVDYSNLVGGSVGAMMLPFLAPNERFEALEAPARHLGIAMQITNITRDVGEDAQRLDRIYLPREWMDDHDVAVDDLTNGTVRDAYPGLLERVMAAAEDRYERGMAGIADLPARVRFGIRSAARMYREIMNEVRANHYDNLNHRAYTSLGRKLWLMAFDTYERRKQSLTA